MRVVLVARGEEELGRVVADIRAAGGEAHAIAADVGDKHAPHAIAGTAAALVGPIELLVQAASTLGHVPLRPLLDTDCEALHGERLRIAPELDVVVEDLDPVRPRLLGVRFSLSGAALWAALYRHGRPVQYAHVDRPLDLWHVQTPFASRPWAVEMPSAGRPLTWALLGELRARGVHLASLTHAAGLSSTGDPAIDAVLPLPERFDLPAATVREIAETHAAGRRVVAAGTTVVRALEGSARLHAGELVAGEGTTDLRIDARFRPRVVDGLLTGLHELGSSHRDLMQAFAPEPLLARAWTHAEERGYQDHEFGDVCLVLPRLAR
jgi:S-adenosylmethionine:tRNA ribosyltransferase-isomerase